MIAIIGCIFIYSIFFTYMARIAVKPKVHTLEHEKEYLLGLKMMQGESIDIKNEHRITTFDGTKLWVGFVESDKNSKYYVISSHGYTSSRYGMYKYAVLWRKMGYHCILYDNRGHGANDPDFISFGVRESQDLMAVIEDTYQRYGEDIHLGLHGESMGSGLQVMALRYHPKVDFIVNDCGYSEILPVIQWKAKQSFHFPGIFAVLASPFCKLFYGYWFEEVRPIDCLKENEIPICFVHGVADTFTHVWHSEKMYETNKGYKELHLFENADHAECVVADTQRYEKMLYRFTNKIYKKDIGTDE